MHELRLLNPDGYLALHPQARTVVPAEDTAATERHLMTVVAPADAAAPYNQGAGYQPYAYRVQTTPLPEESRPFMTAVPTPSGCRHCGVPEREHARRWKPPVGWHKWAAPTDEQRKTRMTARRNARTAHHPF